LALVTLISWPGQRESSNAREGIKTLMNVMATSGNSAVRESSNAREGIKTLSACIALLLQQQVRRESSNAREGIKT